MANQEQAFDDAFAWLGERFKERTIVATEKHEQPDEKRKQVLTKKEFVEEFYKFVHQQHVSRLLNQTKQYRASDLVRAEAYEAEVLKELKPVLQHLIEKPGYIDLDDLYSRIIMIAREARKRADAISLYVEDILLEYATISGKYGLDVEMTLDELEKKELSQYAKEMIQERKDMQETLEELGEEVEGGGEDG